MSNGRAPTPTRKEFGRRLQQLREAKGWTTTELGERAGTDDGTVSKLENGLRWPSSSMVDRLAEAFGVHWRELYLGAHEAEVQRLADRLAGASQKKRIAILQLLDAD